MRTDKIRKYVLPNLPYLFILWACLKVGTAYRLAAGAGFGEKLLGIMQTIGPTFADFAPGVAPADWLVGIMGAVAFRLLIHYKTKKAKKFRHDLEYGSARWGTEKDIKPFTDPVFSKNVILSGTEFLTINTRPKNPANARNLNTCIIGSSGSGKTRFWLTPQLLQAHSSYCVVDPKGGVLSQVGWFLQKKKGYKIKVFNSIDFSKSMHYNPLAYIKNEADILKFVNTLISNTKGDGKDPKYWVIDPEAAENVRRIYQMGLEGFGLAETAAALGQDGIFTPTHYWQSKGVGRGGSKSTLEPTKWGHTTIKKILGLQEYCGDVINFKTYSKSYKMKTRIENAEENKAVFLNVHEAVIDRATWEKVQSMKSGIRRKKPAVTQERSIFSGLLKCPECGANLNFHFNQGNHDIKFFSCANHNSGLRKCSATHYIRLEFLEQVVLQEIRRLTQFADEYENDFVKAIIGHSAKVAENGRARKQRELDGLLARDKELDNLFERLYEDNVAGKIDDARFAKMSKRYEEEQGENAGKIKLLKTELKKSGAGQVTTDFFLDTIRRYTGAQTLTQRMVAELIDHIDVYHAEKEDGITTQRVDIHYNCIGVFAVPDRRNIPEVDVLMETRKGVAVSYSPARIA